MNDFLTLRLLDRLQGLFGRLGVDYPLMRLILRTKLTMDRRRVPVILSGTAKKGSDEPGDAGESNHFLKGLGMYAFMGIVMAPFLFIGGSWMFQMSIVFSLFMFLLSSSFISDFSSVLLDTRDKTILYTRPVNRRTLQMARTVHVLVYMTQMTLAIAAAPLLVSVFRHGPLFTLLFLVELALMDLLILVLTALLYLLILKRFDGERLKDLINMVQIALSVSIMIGYQLVSRAFQLIGPETTFTPSWWNLLLPPLWFGAPFGWLLQGDRHPYLAVLSAMALLIPVLALLIYVRAMPSFERYLVKLTSHDAPAVRGRKTGGRLSALLCRSPEERAFFRFAYRMMGSEREFKLKVYPSLGFSLVFPFVFPLQTAMLKGWSDMAAGSAYYAIYLCAMLVPTLILMLGYSGSYKGAWIYGAAPLRDTGAIYRGTLKAAITRLLLPIFLLDSLLFMALYGLRIAPDLAAVLLGLCLFSVLSFRILGFSLPFSRPFNEAQSEGWRALPLLLLLAVFPGLHLLSKLIGGGLYLYIAILFVGNYLAWSTLGRKTPAEVQSTLTR
ncbi:hypothetical protein J2T17_002111 [Paenibacillus mucilaginosus]|uniref:hypothetical protein n=1 Tax=Paenibacillus mucilaginosus TaxID=61624 RepID=UPI003D1EEEA7